MIHDFTYTWYLNKALLDGHVVNKSLPIKYWLVELDHRNIDVYSRKGLKTTTKHNSSSHKLVHGPLLKLSLLVSAVV